MKEQKIKLEKARSLEQKKAQKMFLDKEKELNMVKKQEQKTAFQVKKQLLLAEFNFL